MASRCGTQKVAGRQAHTEKVLMRHGHGSHTHNEGWLSVRCLAGAGHHCSQAMPGSHTGRHWKATEKEAATERYIVWHRAGRIHRHGYMLAIAGRHGIAGRQAGHYIIIA